MGLTPLEGRNCALIVVLLALTKINSYHSLSLEVWHHEPAIHHGQLVNQDAWTRIRSTRESSWNQVKRFRFQICPLLFILFQVLATLNQSMMTYEGREQLVVLPMHGLGDFQKQNNLIHKHISDKHHIFSPNRVVQFLERFAVFVKMEVYCHAGVWVVCRGKVCHWPGRYTYRPKHWEKKYISEA